MLLEFIKKPAVLMIICMIIVFGEMFFAKKWFTSFTAKIKNETARTGANVVLGIISCFALAAAQMFALCDVLGATYDWVLVTASALGATLLYVLLEKVFGNAKINALGKAFREFISHSDMFDGDLSTDGMVKVAEKLLNITHKIDNEIASKEAKTVDAVVEQLSGFLSDGKITEAERVQAEKLIKDSGVNLTGNSTYEKYRALLNK